MVSRYSIMAHTMEPEELGKVRPTTFLRFMRATKRFSWPLVVLGLRIWPNIHGLSAGRLRLSAPKVKVKVRRHICIKFSCLCIHTNNVKRYIPSTASAAVMPTNADRSSTLMQEYARATRLKALFLVASEQYNQTKAQIWDNEMSRLHFNKN